MDRVIRVAGGWACAFVLAATPAPAQAPEQGSTRDTLITPGARYAAGGLHTLLFGKHYRELWTTPIRVELLDLGGFAGGLRPVQRGGGKQTRSLRLTGADGREYQFRSVDKDPSPLLPEPLRRTLAQRIFQDQISAGHPAGPLVVSPMLSAAGVLHSEPRLVLMPDDPALGEFRSDFAGVLGTIEERQTDEGAGFAGASKIISTDALFKRLENHQDERVDARAYLTARLVDLLLGDWDRHQDQWRWAQLGEGDSVPWTPIPRDRDQAFARFDGLLLSLARLSVPQLIEFSPTYPSMVGITWNARVVDRRLLTGLERGAWDSAAADLQSRMTDEVIDASVERLPAELRKKNGPWLAAALKQRRDQLPTAARRFYRLLAVEVEVHGSDKAERVTAVHSADGTLDLTIFPDRPDNAAALYRRRFDRADTREVRLYLQGGNDVVSVGGAGGSAPLLRVVGGGGDDRVTDSSRVSRTRFYDSRGTSVTNGVRRIPLDDRPYPDFHLSDSTPYPRRDWGGFWRFRPWVSSAPDVGLFVGGGVVRYNFGFRKQPFRSKLALRGGYATGARRFRGEFLGEFRRVNSQVRTSLLLRASGIEVIRFFGFGNDTPRLVDDDAFYRVPQEQYLVAPSIAFPVGARGSLSLGPVLKFTDTDLEPGRFIALSAPPGTGSFGQVGGTAALEWDSRDHPVARRGVHLLAGGSVYPAIWDVESAFGEVHAEAATYLTPHTSFGPTLALRAGAKKVLGDFPFFESAFIGGASTVRGLREQRYAGEASLSGSAELRLRLGKFYVVLPGDYGVFGIADVGRVYLDGETSDTWHSGFGGGLWLAFLEPGNTLSLSVVRGDERTALYFKAGFGY
ncbi:MAG TPA: BamA/TamA family outer membrane protein [Gemmatimonadales bacterium]|nr:BamA/TamA family outer membrane protein [Gemmatimonadales bacterium]